MGGNISKSPHLTVCDSLGKIGNGPFVAIVPQKVGWRDKQRQRSSRLFGGENLFNSLPRQLFCLCIVLLLYSPFSSISYEQSQGAGKQKALRVVLIARLFLVRATAPCAAFFIFTSPQHFLVNDFAPPPRYFFAPPRHILGEQFAPWKIGATVPLFFKNSFP